MGQLARPNLSQGCVALAVAMTLAAGSSLFAQDVRTITVLDANVSPYYFSPPVRGTCTFTAHIDVPLDIPGIVSGQSQSHRQDGVSIVLHTVVDLVDPSGSVIREVTSDQVIQPLDHAPGGGQHSIVEVGTVTWNGHLANGALAPDAIYTFRLSATLSRVEQNLHSNGQSGQPRVTLLAQTAAPTQGQVLLDSTPPVVTITFPGPFALLRSGAFPLQAGYTDNLAGVDASTAQVLVNALDMTSSASITSSTLALSLAGGTALPDGPASGQVLVKDRAGNQGSASVQFLVDTIPPRVQITPSDGSTITSLPVTFQVNVTDFGSGLAGAPAKIHINGIDITSRFTTQVPARFQVLNVSGVAQEVDYSYTPSVDDFCALLQQCASSALTLAVDTQDRAGNPTHAESRVTVNLPSGGGGVEVPPVIQLQDARPSQLPLFPLPATNRCEIGYDFIVRAVDLARAQAPVAGVLIEFASPQNWGTIIDHPTLGPVTNDQGLAGVRWIAGPTAGTYPFVVSVETDPSVPSLQFTASATEPSFDPVDSVQVAPGSGVPSVIRVHAWASQGMTNLTGETVRIGMVNGQGQQVPVDESQFFVMPSDGLTDAGGVAAFVFGAMPSTQPGSYAFRASLTEWNESTDFYVTVIDPSTLVTSLPGPPDGSSRNRNIYLSVVSGNGQVGAQNATLANALVVRLMQNGGATSPINESYPRQDQNGNPLPTLELHIRKVDFTIIQGGGTLNPPSGTQVALDGSGQATTTLTFGPSTEPHIVAVSIVEEFGTADNLQTSEFPGGAIFAEGTPEVRWLDGNGAVTRYPKVSAVYNSDWTAASPNQNFQSAIEVRAPVGWASAVTASVQSLDACMQALSPRTGAVASPQFSVPLTAGNDTPRFRTFTSTTPIQLTQDVVLEAPLAVDPIAGEIVIQSVVGGYVRTSVEGLADGRARCGGHAFTTADGRVRKGTTLINPPLNGGAAPSADAIRLASFRVIEVVDGVTGPVSARLTSSVDGLDLVLSPQRADTLVSPPLVAIRDGVDPSIFTSAEYTVLKCQPTSDRAMDLRVSGSPDDGDKAYGTWFMADRIPVSANGVDVEVEGITKKGHEKLVTQAVTALGYVGAEFAILSYDNCVKAITTSNNWHAVCHGRVPDSGVFGGIIAQDDSGNDKDFGAIDISDADAANAAFRFVYLGCCGSAYASQTDLAANADAVNAGSDRLLQKMHVQIFMGWGSLDHCPTWGTAGHFAEELYAACVTSGESVTTEVAFNRVMTRGAGKDAYLASNARYVDRRSGAEHGKDFYISLPSTRR